MMAYPIHPLKQPWASIFQSIDTGSIFRVTTAILPDGTPGVLDLYQVDSSNRRPLHPARNSLEREGTALGTDDVDMVLLLDLSTVAFLMLSL